MIPCRSSPVFSCQNLSRSCLCRSGYLRFTVILAEEFAEVFDGFSIGSNDLTHLILGVDRDAEIVAQRASSVTLVSLSLGVSVVHINCGFQDYRDFAQFVVERGIDSISLNPDTIMRTTVAILEQE